MAGGRILIGRPSSLGLLLSTICIYLVLVMLLAGWDTGIDVMLANAARISVVDKLLAYNDNDKLKVFAIQMEKQGQHEIKRSINTGATWQNHDPKDVPYREWTSVAASSITGQYVYATANMGGLWRSDDYMKTFKLVTDEDGLMPENKVWSYVSVSSTGMYVVATTKHGNFGRTDRDGSLLRYSNDYGISWKTDLPESDKRFYIATAITENCNKDTSDIWSCNNPKFVTVWLERDKDTKNVSKVSSSFYYFINGNAAKGIDRVFNGTKGLVTADEGDISMYGDYGIVAFRTGDVFYVDVSKVSLSTVDPIFLPKQCRGSFTSVFVAGGGNDKAFFLSEAESKGTIYRLEYTIEPFGLLNNTDEEVCKAIAESASWSGVAGNVNGQILLATMESSVGTNFVRTMESSKIRPVIKACPRGFGLPSNDSAYREVECDSCDYEEGYYNNGNSKACRKCTSTQHGVTMDGRDCMHCDYPWVSLYTPINGYGSCHLGRMHLDFDISPLFYAGIITGLVFFYFLPHFFIYNELGVIDLRTGFGLFFYTCLPACSSLCHLCYLMKNPFYNMPLYIVSCLSLGLSSSILFSRRLLSEKAYPQMWITPLPVWALEEGYWDWCGQFCKCAFSAVKLVPYVLLNFPSSFLIFVMGAMLYDIKVFPIGSIRNTFYFYWTGLDDFQIDCTVDAHTLNEMTIANLWAQAIPWLLLMLVNNNAVGEWNELSIVSVIVCMMVIAACFYKYAERFFVYKKPLLETPIKFSLLGNLLIDLDADLARFGVKRGELNRQRKQIEFRNKRGGRTPIGSPEEAEFDDIYDQGDSRIVGGRFRGSENQESIALLEGRMDSMDMKVMEIEHTVVDIITEVKKIKKFIAKKL